MLMNPIVSEALGPFWLIAFQCPLGIPIYLFYLGFGWEGVGSLGHQKWRVGGLPFSMGLNNSVSVEPREEKEAGSGLGKGQEVLWIQSPPLGNSVPRPQELPQEGGPSSGSGNPGPMGQPWGMAASLDSLDEPRWSGRLDQLPR